jgi:poly-gamma-glutamate synthesis protein (capsule biosynthesis protein)
MLVIPKRRLALTKRPWFLIVFAFLLVVALGVWAYGLFVPRADEQLGRQEVPQKPVASLKAAESRMLVFGDVYWGRYINDWSMASPLKYAYPFQNLNQFERDSYDAWIADMECPITNNPKVSSAVEDSTLSFDCSPEYLTEAKKWFSAFTLANNHTDNQGGQAGLDETRTHLAQNGIQNFGTFDPEDHANVCEVLSIPTRITMSDGSKKQGKLPLAWCGYHGVFKTPTAESIAEMQRYSAFNIVAMPHSGAEYKAAPDEIKTTFYRALIDGGADVVIGDHAHWIQNAEAYKGKLIMYSLGNFIFDQQFNAEVTRGAQLDMTVSVEAKDAKDLEAWLALGEACKGYGDDCIQQAAKQQLKKLPLKYHFKVTGSNNSGKLVKRASDTELASIKQRLQWQQTIAGLSGNNSGE